MASPIERAKKNRRKSSGGKGGYDWGDGKGAVHSRPKRTASQLGKAKDAKRLSDPTYFNQPMTLGQALSEGESAANLQYGPQIAQVQLQQRQTPAWFDQYRASLQTPQQVQQTYAPAIAQQQAVANETGQATRGIDPNSAAGQQDALAAKAREALVNLGTGVLTAGQQADTTYFQGRQGVANAAQIGAQTQLGNQLGSLQGQRGAAVAQHVADVRGAERDYGLAAQHQKVENAAFGLDVAKQQADVQTDRAKIKQTAKQNRQKARQQAHEVNKYGYTNAQWGRFSPSHRQRIMRQQDSSSGGAKAPKTFTPSQHHQAKTDLRKGVALIQSKLAGKQSAPDDFWQKAYQALIQEKDMDPALARAAVQLVRLGSVGRKTRQTLQDDYGITNFPKGKRRKKPPAYKLPNDRPGNAPAENGERRPTRYTPDRDTGGPKFYKKVRRYQNSNPRWAGYGRRSIT